MRNLPSLFAALIAVPLAFATSARAADPHWASTGAVSYGAISVVTHPTDPTRLYAFPSSQAISRSTDAGRTFTAPRPLPSGAVLLDPWDPDVLWTSGASLFRSANGGDSWTKVGGEDVFRDRTAILETRPATLLLTRTRMCTFSCVGGGLYRSTNGIDWQLLAFADTRVGRVYTFPRYPRLIYATVDNPPKLMRSADGGASWDQMFGSANLPYLVAIDPFDQDTIYGVYNYLYKSSDAGRSWTRISTGLPVNDMYGPTVQTCVVDPTNPAHLYAAMNDEAGVYESRDGGGTWNPLVGGSRVRFAGSLAIDPTGQRLYAGTATRGAASALGGAPRAEVFGWSTDPFTRILPSAASIHGVNGAFFHTDVRVFNPSPTVSVGVAIRYHCFIGTCDGESRSVTLAPREQKVLDDIAANLLQAPDSAGPIEFSSDYPVVITSRTYTPEKPAPTVGQFVPSLSLADAAHEAVLTSLSHAANPVRGFRTNIGIVGPYDMAQTVSIEIYDSTARKLGSVSRLLPAQQAIQINDADLFREAGITDDLPDFYAVVRGEGIWPVFAYATVIDNVSQDSIFVAARNP